MKFLFLFAVSGLALAFGAAIEEKDDNLDKDFQSIEKALEEITKKEAKQEMEADKLKLPHFLEKDAKKDDSKTIEDLAKELKDPESKKETSKYSEEALHKIMKEYDVGAIKLDKLVKSLEDFFKKESDDMALLMNDVETESKDAKCEDNRKDCHKFVKYCTTHKKTMKKKCPKTCKFCVKCENKYGDKNCKTLGKVGYCDKKGFKLRMKQVCNRECGHCRLPTQLHDCTKSQHGCCWDGKTVMADPEGKNCPACDDKYRYACPQFRPDCMKNNGAGKFMRKMCSKTCQLCTRCMDDPKYKDNCKSWAELGWCGTLATTMNALCKRTCKLC